MRQKHIFLPRIFPDPSHVLLQSKGEEEEGKTTNLERKNIIIDGNLFWRSQPPKQHPAWGMDHVLILLLFCWSDVEMYTRK